MLDIVIIPIILFLICISLGIVVKRYFDFNTDKNIFIVGFVAFFATFYLIATPFMIFKLKITYMILIMKVFYAIMIAFAVGLFLKKFNKDDISISIKQTFSKLYSNKYQLILCCMFAIMVLYQITYVVFFQHTDIDDSYYLAQANTFSFTDYIGSIEPSSGLNYLNVSKQYFLVGFEIIYTVLNRIFGVNVAYLAHSIWPIFAILSHYVVVYNIAKKINKSMKWEYCIVYSVINLFGGYTTYTSGAFLLNRIWQGKAVLVAIYIPIMVLEFLEMNKKIDKQELVYIWMILLAGISTTTVAIYLFPILFFCEWVGKGISERKINTLLKLCIPILAILPWVALKLKFMYTAGNDGTSVQQAVANGFDGLSYTGQLFSRYMNGHNIMIVVFIVSSVIILALASSKIRSVIVYPAIILFITFANPLLIKYVARWVTGVDVYWRIFWLFRGAIVYSTASILLIGLCKIDKEKVFSIIAILSLIVACGTSVFENGGWEVRNNKYKLDSRTVQIVDSIHADSTKKNKVLLLPEDMSYGVREYCGDICPIVNRYSGSSFNASGMENRYNLFMTNIYNPLYVDQIWDYETLKDGLSDYGIDYVVIYTNALQNNQILNDDYTCIYQNDEFILYRCK